MALNLLFPRSLPVVPCRPTSFFCSLTSVFLPSNRLRNVDRTKIERPIAFYSTHCISSRPIHTTAITNRDHPAPGALPALHHPAPNLRLDTEEEAEALLYYLRKSEREMLYKVLQQHHKKVNGDIEVEDDVLDKAQSPITKEQLRLLFWCNSLPFIGFGILDNLLMILAGEYIDSTLGVVFGLSTMAAAGFGNIISDIAGVGLAHYVEFFVAKFFGVRPPPLTAEQWDSSKARWTSNSARAFGLTVGCLIGMFPLFFYDETEKQEKKLKAKSQLSTKHDEGAVVASG